MAQIGSVLCTFVRGWPPRQKNRVAVWTVVGMNGHGAQTVGYNDAAFHVKAVLFSDILGVNAWKTNLEALQGKIVTIVNDCNISFPNCLINKVSPMQSMAVRAAGGITQRAEITIEGVVTQ